MKRLYFLLPVGMWFADYFIFKQAAIILTAKDMNGGIATWWIVSSMLAVMLTIFLGVVAFAENENLSK